MTWLDAVVVVNLIMVICGPVGAYIAIKNTMTKAGQELSDRMQKMLHDENELLQTRLKRCEDEHRQQEKQLELVASMLKKMNKIELEIDGTMVILRDSSGTPHVARIKEE